MIRIQPTEYIVTSLHPDHEGWSIWQIRIEWRGHDLWAVMRFGRQCLGADGTWDHEPQPSSRTDEWMATHRFPLQEARRLAIDEFPKLVVNGKRVERGRLVPARALDTPQPPKKEGT